MRSNAKHLACGWDIRVTVKVGFGFEGQILRFAQDDRWPSPLAGPVGREIVEAVGRS